MRFHIFLCTAFVVLAAITALPPQAHAQTAQGARVVPRFNNADLMALSDREQRIWVHGAVEGFANAILLTNPAGGRCVLTWYADGSARFATIQQSARQYPDNQPVTIIAALANRTCAFYTPSGH